MIKRKEKGKEREREEKQLGTNNKENSRKREREGGMGENIVGDFRIQSLKLPKSVIALTAVSGLTLQPVSSFPQRH